MLECTKIEHIIIFDKGVGLSKSTEMLSQRIPLLSNPIRGISEHLMLYLIREYNDLTLTINC